MAEGAYSIEKLTVLGILLSNGTGAKKAETFFNHVDSECKKSITQEQYTSLITVMIDVAFKYNSILGIGDPDDGYVTET